MISIKRERVIPMGQENEIPHRLARLLPASSGDRGRTNLTVMPE